MTPPGDLIIESNRQLAGMSNWASDLPIRQRGGVTVQDQSSTRLLAAALGISDGQEHSTEAMVPAAGTPDASNNDVGMAIHRGVLDPTGQRQAKKDAQGLMHTPNDKFVAQIEHDCAVGPHLEWSIAGGTILGKSLVKGWILGKAGESLGPSARAGGIATGVAIGTVTGFYTAYETADLLENSCRANAYAERLSQTQAGTRTLSGPNLDPLTQTYDIERGLPGVRTVVDFSSEHIDALFGRTPTDYRSVNLGKALAHKNLDDTSYLAWARRASTVPAISQVEHGLGFAALGMAGGLFAAQKLHLGLPGSLIAASGGALMGVGLSFLGVAAKEDTNLAELLKDRLLSRPHDVPRP